MRSAIFACALMAAGIASGAPAPGDSIKPFTLRTPQGTPWVWNPGRVTVLTFCALWCDTWKDQLPRVQQVRKSTQGLPIDYATVVVDGRWSDRTRSDAGGTLVFDPSGTWTHQLGIDRVPYTLVLDKTGKVSWAGYGTVRADDVRQAAIGAGRTSVSGGPIYLTFDDFPSKKESYELLDLLRKEGVPATFFCIGDDLAERPDVARRAAREGHRLEIHSWSHDGDHPQLEKCVDEIKSLSGQTPELYRPPGSEKVLRLKGGSLSLPVDDPYDYSRPDPDELVRRILLSARPGSVIQLHSGVEVTLDVLEKVIENLRGRGFTFRLLESKG